MYAVGSFVEQALERRCAEYVAVGHAGHGVNSYAMHYFLVYGPLRPFVQAPVRRRLYECGRTNRECGRTNRGRQQPVSHSALD
jgi:hypothetical protein